MGIFLIILLVVFLLSAIFSVVYDGKVGQVSSEIQRYSVIALSAVFVCGIITTNNPQAIEYIVIGLLLKLLIGIQSL